MVERCVTYQKVIHHNVRVRPIYEKISCGNCKVSKQKFWTFKKLIHRPFGWDRTHVSEKVNDRESGRSGHYKSLL